MSCLLVLVFLLQWECGSNCENDSISVDIELYLYIVQNSLVHAICFGCYWPYSISCEKVIHVLADYICDFACWCDMECCFYTVTFSIVPVILKNCTASWLWLDEKSICTVLRCYCCYMLIELDLYTKSVCIVIGFTNIIVIVIWCYMNFKLKWVKLYNDYLCRREANKKSVWNNLCDFYFSQFQMNQPLNFCWNKSLRFLFSQLRIQFAKSWK